ncbi:Secreted protein [Pseudomonas sp. IT-P74]|uniref:Uncharacterized protein n=1 Tax=Pseudomonas fluorescens TaxID=294 RepID=A0A5E7TSB3_PSEFL|nr:hypothetical protein BSF44_23250 [Pseudomonas sp. ACN8]VVQ01862.1 hypothetical protein PS938_02557 [Pseudomonas fluorescens]
MACFVIRTAARATLLRYVSWSILINIHAGSPYGYVKCPCLNMRDAEALVSAKQWTNGENEKPGSLAILLFS